MRTSNLLFTIAMIGAPVALASGGASPHSVEDEALEQQIGAEEFFAQRDWNALPSSKSRIDLQALIELRANLQAFQSGYDSARYNRERGRTSAMSDARDIVLGFLTTTGWSGDAEVDYAGWSEILESPLFQQVSLEYAGHHLHIASQYERLRAGHPQRATLLPVYENACAELGKGLEFLALVSPTRADRVVGIEKENAVLFIYSLAEAFDQGVPPCVSKLGSKSAAAIAHLRDTYLVTQHVPMGRRIVYQSECVGLCFGGLGGTTIGSSSKAEDIVEMEYYPFYRAGGDGLRDARLKVRSSKDLKDAKVRFNVEWASGRRSPGSPARLDELLKLWSKRVAP